MSGNATTSVSSCIYVCVCVCVSASQEITFDRPILNVTVSIPELGDVHVINRALRETEDLAAVHVCCVARLAVHLKSMTPSKIKYASSRCVLIHHCYCYLRAFQGTAQGPRVAEYRQLGRGAVPIERQARRAGVCRRGRARDRA